MRRGDRTQAIATIALALTCAGCGDAARPVQAERFGADRRPPPDPRPSPASATAKPADDLAQGAALKGDPVAQERAILALDNADLPEDVLLGLPGSEGIALEHDAVMRVPEGGESVGTPQAGSVQRAVQLPLVPHLYTRRDAARSFGSTHTVRTILSALAAMRSERNQTAEVVIGDLSLPRGGTFAPHVSHQAGRDVDVRLVLAPGVERTTVPSAPEHVDWDATWALVHSFLETGQVTHVFLNFDRQSHLFEAARRAGVHARVLEAWFQWPVPGGPGIVRHEDGHLAHVHIRLACAPTESRCTGR